jgi:hypothetical protein
MPDLSLEFLADVLETSPGELTQALKDGEQFKPQADIEAFVKSQFGEKLLSAKLSGKKEGKSWGEKESLTAKEKALKAKFGVEGANLEEIIDNAVEAAKSHSKLNPEDVKSSEVFISETKRLKQLLKDKEDEIASKVSSFQKAETMRVAKEAGLRLLKEKNFVLPENEDIKETMLSTLFEKLEDDHTRVSIVDGKIVILDANGRIKENESGTRELSFEDHFVSKSKKFFTQAVADNRQSPGHKNNEPKPVNTNPDMPEMKNTEDYIKALSSEKDVTKQKAIKEHYNKLVEDGSIT